MTDHLIVKQIASKRSISRLAELQHRLNQDVALLSAQQSRLLGALMACDADTQRIMMLEYRDQLHAVHSTLSRLCIIIDRYGDPAQR